jgi:hypothetical protein
MYCGLAPCHPCEYVFILTTGGCRSGRVTKLWTSSTEVTEASRIACAGISRAAVSAVVEARHPNQAHRRQPPGGVEELPTAQVAPAPFGVVGFEIVPFVCSAAKLVHRVPSPTRRARDRLIVHARLVRVKVPSAGTADLGLGRLRRQQYLSPPPGSAFHRCTPAREAKYGGNCNSLVTLTGGGPAGNLSLRCRRAWRGAGWHLAPAQVTVTWLVRPRIWPVASIASTSK